jgi:hypothetical protein
MKRLATILVIALAATALAASSAFAKAPQHSGQPVKDQDDTAAIVALAVIGVLVAGSALVPLERRRRRTATRAQASVRPVAAGG